jgi:branched-subunit amino acid ABC-type transport system permease component
MNLGHTVNLGVGMMLGFIVIQQTNITPILGAPVSFLLTGGFNAAIYLLFYRRMESKKYSEALISLFGLVSVFLGRAILTVATYWVTFWFGSEYWCGTASEPRFILNHLHYRVPKMGVFTGGFIEVMLLFASIVTVSYWFYRDNSSFMFRAAAEDLNLLEVCGVNSRNVKTLAWFIAGGLGGVAGVMSPFSVKGEFGRDVELLFVPVVLAAIVVEKRELWIAGVAGFFVGFTQITLINFGQKFIGVWIGEYWNLLNVIFLVIVLILKDRRLKLPSWVFRARP